MLLHVGWAVDSVYLSAMPLKYPVSAKTILLCDYNMGGFKPPEMVKRRPAIVLVGRLANRGSLHTVVPLSGSESKADYHCKIQLDNPLPEPFAETIWWVKADMVATVSLKRLELFRTQRDNNGNRKYLTGLKVNDEIFDVVKQHVKKAMKLD